MPWLDHCVLTIQCIISFKPELAISFTRDLHLKGDSKARASELVFAGGEGYCLITFLPLHQFWNSKNFATSLINLHCCTLQQSFIISKTTSRACLLSYSELTLAVSLAVKLMFLPHLSVQFLYSNFQNYSELFKKPYIFFRCCTVPSLICN